MIVERELDTAAGLKGIEAEQDHELAALPAASPTGRVEVGLVQDPPWSPERMTETARRQLGWG